ncbi:hypothetical protein BH11BAC7_BH11BAC7_26910 [soil metagenome]
MYGLNPISPNEERSKTLILFFRIYLILLAFCAFVEFVTAASFSGSLDLLDTTKIILGVTIISVIRLIAYLTLAIIFIMWMRRAYNNLHKAGYPNLRHKEGWASGAWFVPFVNLGRPVIIMREIWNATQHTFRRQGVTFEKTEDNITGSWWTLFLLSNFATQIGSYLLRDREYEAGYTMAAIGTIAYILCGFIAINMIKRISHMETDMLGRADQYYEWLTHQQAIQYQLQQNANPENALQPENSIYPENLRQPYPGEQNNSQDNLLSVIRDITQLETDMMPRSKEYYAWFIQQQAEQNQQQHSIVENQNSNTNHFQPENPAPPKSNEENNSQDNFYKP